MTVRAAFRVQGEACAALGSPFMDQLMSLIGERLSEGAVAEHVLNWPGDPSVSADSVPLRFAGALHALRLQELAFSRVYPPHEVGDEGKIEPENRFEATVAFTSSICPEY